MRPSISHGFSQRRHTHRSGKTCTAVDPCGHSAPLSFAACVRHVAESLPMPPMIKLHIIMGSRCIAVRAAAIQLMILVLCDANVGAAVSRHGVVKIKALNGRIVTNLLARGELCARVLI